MTGAELRAGCLIVLFCGALLTFAGWALWALATWVLP